MERHGQVIRCHLYERTGREGRVLLRDGGGSMRRPTEG